jgi:DNA polymerase III alpha subunit
LPAEVLAAYELAHLGFYVSAPFEVQRHMHRLVEEFGVAPIAELVDLPDRAPASVAGIVTALRVRTTKKGERMVWLTLADGTAPSKRPSSPRRTAETATRSERAARKVDGLGGLNHHARCLLNGHAE